MSIPHSLREPNRRLVIFEGIMGSGTSTSTRLNGSPCGRWTAVSWRRDQPVPDEHGARRNPATHIGNRTGDSAAGTVDRVLPSRRHRSGHPPKTQRVTGLRTTRRSGLHWVFESAQARQEAALRLPLPGLVRAAGRGAGCGGHAGGAAGLAGGVGPGVLSRASVVRGHMQRRRSGLSFRPHCACCRERPTPGREARGPRPPKPAPVWTPAGA